jgi:hypothetical protein
MKQKRISNAKSAEVGIDAGAGGAATFSRRELRDHCGWSLTQVRLHLERLAQHEFVAVRHGRLGCQFVYEALFDLEAPEAVAHVSLIDVAKLKGNGPAPNSKKTLMASSAAVLTGVSGRVAGPNGHLTGGDGKPPPPVRANEDRALVTT